MPSRNHIQTSLEDYRLSLANDTRLATGILIDNVLTSELLKFNLWWKTGEFPTNDPDIENCTTSNFKWKPRLRKTLKDVDVRYILRGPRRVGKTTLLKLRIKGHLAEGVRAQQIFYFPCDSLFNPPFHSPRDLTAVIDTYLNKIRDAEQRAFLYLDEISMIKNYSLHIKPLIDANKFKNCTVLFTGSHSIDLRKTSESLTGRMGDVHKLEYQNTNKVLLQAKFAEYVATRDKTIRNEIESLNLHRFTTRKKILSSLVKGQIPIEIRRLSNYNQELDGFLADYLTTGGLVQAVHQFVSTQYIPQYVYSNFIDLVTRDLVRWRYKERFAQQLLGRIIETVTTQVSWSALRKGTAIRDPKTAESNIKILSDIFVVNYHYPLSLEKSLAHTNTTADLKKFYIRDPFIFHACRGWVAGEDAFDLSQKFLSSETNAGKLLECVFSDHVSRLAYSLHYDAPHFSPCDHVCYLRTKKNKEVDFSVKMDGRYLPIEVKYTDNIKSEDTESVRGIVKDAHIYDRGLITSKNRLEVSERYVIVPASMLLMLI
jgi:uncharacterized protein